MRGLLGLTRTNTEETKTMLVNGLHKIQHLGTNTFGGVFLNQNYELVAHHQSGLVADSLADGKSCIAACGLVSGRKNDLAQPFLIKPSMKRLVARQFAVTCHGFVQNSQSLIQMILDSGKILSANNASGQNCFDPIPYLFLQQGYPNMNFDIINQVCQLLRGAYNFLILTNTALIAVRDPHGYHYLFLGQRDDGACMICSETTPFKNFGFQTFREIEPGEIIFIPHERKLPIEQYSLTAQEIKKCSYSILYTMMPNAMIGGREVWQIREHLGVVSGSLFTGRADLIVGVPDSSTSHAVGVAEALKLPMTQAIIRGHYWHRFALSQSSGNHQAVLANKYDILPEKVKNKSIVLVEDSCLSGETLKFLVAKLKKYARQIHVLITSPLITRSCPYGVDFGRAQKLIGATHDQKQMMDYIAADSLTILDYNAYQQEFFCPASDLCSECFMA